MTKKNRLAKLVSFPPKGALPLRLVLGLALAVGLDTALQTLWKHLAQSTPSGSAVTPQNFVEYVLREPWFAALGLLILAQMVNWLRVLRDADVSFALPITAISYLSVAGVSAIWLHEPITPGRVAGMALILAGVYLVGRTDHDTIGSR